MSRRSALNVARLAKRASMYREAHLMDAFFDSNGVLPPTERNRATRRQLAKAMVGRRKPGQRKASGYMIRAARRGIAKSFKPKDADAGTE